MMIVRTYEHAETKKEIIKSYTIMDSIKKRLDEIELKKEGYKLIDEMRV